MGSMEDIRDSMLVLVTGNTDSRAYTGLYMLGRGGAVTD